ncbi:MAG: tRNA lysidine(34) synthetase TilS [Flavobacteriales bacterium]|nr:tRNA lysidine(34) synthetase TilS [Flavobacteriales bacterium]
MLSQLAKKIRSQDLPKGKALLAVSAGVDSMVLWAVFRELKLPYAIAHFNFQLRGDESNQDQALVRQIAKDYQAEHHLKIESAEDYAEENKLSIQEAAREMRYNWFDELIEAAKADYLITAHHLDDSLETFLINLNRGTGLRGLSGIQNRKGVHRPFLEITKDELLEYASEFKIAYREDSSNAKDAYLRNWFRKHLIPLWKEKNPQLLERMRDTFQHLNESQAIEDHYLQREIDKRLSSKVSSSSFDTKEFQRIEFPEATLRHWLVDLGFTADQIQQLVKSIESTSIGAIYYSGSHKVLIDREQLILERMQENDMVVYTISSFGSISIPGYHLIIEECDLNEVELGNKSVEYFDADKLSFPLEFRNWESGDRMHPLGMSGEKKISDILIDDKVSRFEKEKQYLMCSNSKIAWLLGNRISESFKMDESTKKAIRIKWMSH